MKMLSLKMYDTGLPGSPQGTSPNASYVAFWGYFASCIPIFRPLSFPTHSSPTPSPPLPFSKEVNKKLSYRAETALSVTKHTNTITTANTQF